MTPTSEYYWAEYQHELAKQLLRFRANSSELLNLYSSSRAEYGLGPDDKPVRGLDPFSFFSRIENIKNVQHRQKFFSIVGAKLGVELAPPATYPGVATNNHTSRDYFNYEQQEENLEILWALFELALCYEKSTANESKLAELINSVANIPQNQVTKISIGLSWINATVFPACDTNNVRYLQQYDSMINSPKSGKEYIEYVRKATQVMNEQRLGSFMRISALAYKENKKSNSDEQTAVRKKDAGMKESLPSNIVVHPLNLILYGPPGTGKTYNAVNKALEIIEGEPVDPNEKRSEVIDRYKKLVDAGRIGFATFHQSFSYEDFTEGIRPVVDTGEEQNGMRYIVAPGCFKQFCEQAQPTTVESLNNSPAIWKITLNQAKPNPVKDDCFKNGKIRVGYPGITSDEVKGCPGNTDDIDTLKKFFHKMKQGDVVCSCCGENEIDAIGVVLGNPYRDEKFPEYPNVRDVRWLVRETLREKPLDITLLNGGKLLTSTTLYELHRVSLNDLLCAAGIEEEKPDPYVFIIDEINRGNVSAIFGELITLLEEDKRLGAENEQKVTLPYSGDRWGIPSNVHIIGTMNTADRSLTQLDTALRRRFEFEEMMPQPDLLNQDVEGVDLTKLLEAINLRIEALYDREHTIGHAYFMGVKTLDDLRGVFARKVIPLLQEYFFEDYERIRMVLNDRGGRFIQRIEPTLGSLGLAGWDSTASDEELQVRYQIRNQEDWTSEDFRAIYGSASETNSDAE